MSSRDYVAEGVAQRRCLKCQKDFRSQSRSNRICGLCRNKQVPSANYTVPKSVEGLQWSEPTDPKN